MEYKFWVAIYAAIVATIAVALEVRRWVESGVRLWIAIMPNAVIAGHRGDNTYIYITVMNRGNAPTTITHVAGRHYKCRWNWLIRNPDKQFIFPNTGHQEFPFFLEPGKTFSAMIQHSEDTQRFMDKGYFYVEIIGTHRSRSHFVRVKKRKVPT